MNRRTRRTLEIARTRKEIRFDGESSFGAAFRAWVIASNGLQTRRHDRETSRISASGRLSGCEVIASLASACRVANVIPLTYAQPMRLRRSGAPTALATDTARLPPRRHP